MFLDEEPSDPIYNADGSYRIGVDLVAAGVTENIKNVNWILDGIHEGEVYEIYTDSSHGWVKEANVRAYPGGSGADRLLVLEVHPGTPLQLEVPARGYQLRTYLAESYETDVTVYIKRIK